MIDADISAAATVVLAGVFLWAGAAKIVIPAATAASFAQLRLPWPRALATAVPLIELALAGALVAGARAAPHAALVVLVGFTAVLARALAFHEPVVCACFGAARPEPVSGIDLARNALLAVLALASVGSEAAVPSLPALVLVSSLAALGRVGLAVGAFVKVAPLWPGEPER